MVDRKITKRNRVYSIQSNKLHQITFARKYVSYLEPALKKINEKTLSSSSIKQNGGGDNDDAGDGKNGDLYSLEKCVRFEVDMAMVVSANKKFAWSRSLEAQLQQKINVMNYNNNNDVIVNINNNNVGGFQQHGHDLLASNKVSDQSLLGIISSPSLCDSNCNTIVPSLHISKNYYYSISKSTIGGRNRNRNVKVQEEEEGAKNVEEEESIVKSGLRKLRMVLPGGKEMGDDVELLTEIASYISCLQLQVNILQCLVQH